MISIIGSTRVRSARDLKGDLPKGWIYVGRRHSRFPLGSEWGNPYRINKVGMLAGPMFAKLLLRAHDLGRWSIFSKNPAHDCLRTDDHLEAQLKGRDLVCWCVGSGHRCHGEVEAFAAEREWAEVERATVLGWWKA
jgi:Domain of unknown function (DUF4326)